MMKNALASRLPLVAAAVLGLVGAGAHAQIVVNDTLTGASSTYPWIPLGGACLTAGDGTGYIPMCAGLKYYTDRNSKLLGGYNGTMPDSAAQTATSPKGQGALRLTNGDSTLNGSNGTNEYGAVVSNFTFPISAGVNITWTSVTYGGNGYDAGYGKHGADGISFFLSDGAAPVPTAVGGIGGSLGYSCSNTNAVFDGVRGGIVGVGIDEYGNFVNAGDNTSTGIGFNPGRLGVRGPGSTGWAWLNATYPQFYPASTQSSAQAIVQQACKNGYAYNRSGSTQKDSKGNNVANGAKSSNDVLANYAYITSNALPSTVSIANQQAQATSKRTAANPITFQLSIDQDGLLNVGYAISGGSITPLVTNVDLKAANGGSLPASVRFGFAAGTGGGSNIHEITCFKAAAQSQSSTSAGASVQQGQQLKTGNFLYLAYYNTNNWWSQLTASAIDPGTAAILSPTWDANCVLTGGGSSTTCAGTGGPNPVAQSSSARNILTWNGLKGIPFQYSNLTTAQVNALTAGDASQNDARLRYLRGDRTTEVASGNNGGNGNFRARTGVLGDIVNSSPAWVGPPTSPYNLKFVDKLQPLVTAPEGTTYAAFAQTYATRENVVYAGSNDGMLHGFDAGSFATNSLSGGVYVPSGYNTANNNGKELVAYMPAQVLSMIHSTTPSVDFSAVAYSHNFYVDGTPGAGDLYYAGAWHTWLVGGLGAGGQPAGPIGDNTTGTSNSAVFALDITNPSNFAESKAAALVIGEWTPSTITCGLNLACGKNLGEVAGTPQVRRLHDGNWAVLFGNGTNSANGTAGLFIMHVDSTTGLRTFQYIDTGVGSSAGGTTPRNGIVQVSPVDLDGDHITDFVYAGDLYGNLWRFDLTNGSSALWTASAKPLYTTDNGAPITTRPAIATVPTPGSSLNPKVIVAFGTGQKQPITLTSGETYASGTQAMIGIWDWNLSAWNATATDTKVDVLSTSVGPATIATSKLTAQTLTTNTNASPPQRSATSNTVCWLGSSSTLGGCTASNSTQLGWIDVLPGTNEQVIYNPLTAYGEFIVNTTIPAVTAGQAAITCDTPKSSSFTMTVQMINGGASSVSFLGDANMPASVVGLGLNGVGTPTIVRTDGSVAPSAAYLVTGTQTGGGLPQLINPTQGLGSRVNWTKMR